MALNFENIFGGGSDGGISADYKSAGSGQEEVLLHATVLGAAANTWVQIYQVPLNNP